MNQLQAIIESARTGREYLLLEHKEVRRVYCNRLQRRLRGGSWSNMDVDDLHWVSEHGLVYECAMLDPYTEWFESLPAEDREAVEMSQREVRAWEACAWMATHPGSEFTNGFTRFRMVGNLVEYTSMLGRWVKAETSVCYGGFRLILRDDLAAKLREFGREVAK